MPNIMISCLAGFFFAWAVSAAVPAASQDYPTRNITLVVPFGAGTGADVTGRIAAQLLGASLKTAVIVENRVSAGGIVGTTEVARSAPDGYTLLFVSNSTHGTNPGFFKNLTYDPVTSFAPVGEFGSFTFLLVVNSQLPFKDLQDLVAFAKSSPGKLTFAAGQTTSRIMAEVFKQETGTNILFVPYRNSPQALTDLVAGRVSMMFIDLESAGAFLKNGALRALAVTSRDRSPLLPEVPSVAESLGSEFQLEAWVGVVAPAGTPPAIIDKLNGALNAGLKAPDVRDRLFAMGVQPKTTTPAEFSDFIKSEVFRLGNFIREANIKPQ